MYYVILTLGKKAFIEEVVQALFNAPSFIDPSDISQISLYYPEAKAKYLNLFYSRNIPNSVKKIHKL